MFQFSLIPILIPSLNLHLRPNNSDHSGDDLLPSSELRRDQNPLILPRFIEILQLLCRFAFRDSFESHKHRRKPAHVERTSPEKLLLLAPASRPLSPRMPSPLIIN